MLYSYLFSLFLLLTPLLQADWDQLFSDSEDPALFHHVNVMTGNLNLSFQDALVQGAKPLPINRTYTSAGALDSPDRQAIINKVHDSWMIQGGWNFLPHIDLLIQLSERIKDFKFYLQEPGGSLIGYTFDHKRSDGRTYVYRASKEILKNAMVYNGRQNLHKYKLAFDKKTGKATLHLPDGSYRIYRGRKFHSWKKSHFISFQKETTAKLYYKLEQEVLPSRHVVSYTYDRYHGLTDVCLQNPAGNKTFASYHITAHDFHTPHYQLEIHTSDHKTITYEALNCKNVGYLSKVNSAKRNEENAYLKERRGIGARLKQILFDNHLEVQVDYYCPNDRNADKRWEDHPDKKPFEADKVRFLSTPTGPHAQLTRLAEFFYQPHLTDVRDVNYRLTRFHHDKGKITAIEYFDGADQLYSVLRFVWKDNFLMSKIMLDSLGNPFLSKTFAYDSAGNIIQETLWGNFTGNCSSLSVNPDGSLSGADHYTKSYTYLPHFNLPIVEEEEGGLTYRYHYLYDSDLLTAKFTCLKERILLREFTFYNEDHLPIKEVRDDGSSTDPNDVRITFRSIQLHKRDPNTGLITETQELCYDSNSGLEQLIRKTVYTYSTDHQVIAEAIYDKEDQHRYTLYSEYDPKGNLISKTSPLGQKNIYTYNGRNQLESAKEVGSLLKRYLYDPAGRPAALEEWDSEGLVKKTYTHYDTSGTLLSQTDEKGNTTYQTYDAFRRCISTRFPDCLDHEGSTYTPEITFAYDVQGNLIATSVRDGNTSSTHYNPLRKPLEEIHPDGTRTAHRYHSNGTIHKTTYADGTTVDYGYDHFQNQTSKTIYSQNGALLSQEKWEYNALHLTSYTDPNGLVTHYTHDAAGRLICEQQEDRCIQIGYDSLGFESSITQADVTQMRRYDVGGRIFEE
jgi:YD repeat-containing protein